MRSSLAIAMMVTGSSKGEPQLATSKCMRTAGCSLAEIRHATGAKLARIHALDRTDVHDRPGRAGWDPSLCWILSDWMLPKSKSLPAVLKIASKKSFIT